MFESLQNAATESQKVFFWAKVPFLGGGGGSHIFLLGIGFRISPPSSSLSSPSYSFKGIFELQTCRYRSRKYPEYELLETKKQISATCKTEENELQFENFPCMELFLEWFVGIYSTNITIVQWKEEEINSNCEIGGKFFLWQKPCLGLEANFLGGNLGSKQSVRQLTNSIMKTNTSGGQDETICCIRMRLLAQLAFSLFFNASKSQAKIRYFASVKFKKNYFIEFYHGLLE